jgi:signal transduction histidine kinase/pSer/pThr/pTyr-binding forkhead associated (FHA) protein
MPELIILSGPHKGQTYKLNKSPYSVGRHMSNDLQLIDQSVSKKHFLIKTQKEQYFLYDLKSRNGTYLNSNLISNSVRLAHEDEIRAGNSLILFSDQNSIQERSDVSIMPQDESTILKSVVVPGGKPQFFDQTAVNQNQLEFLKSAHFYVKTIFEASRSIHAITNLSQLLDKILDLVFDIINADRGAIIFIDPKTKTFQPQVARLRGDKTRKKIDIPVSTSIMRQVMENGDAVLCRDRAIDPRFKNESSLVIMSIHSAIYVPLYGRNEIIGVLVVDSQKPSKDFTNDKVMLLNTLGNIAGIAIENAKLHEQFRDERKGLVLNIQNLQGLIVVESNIKMLAKLANCIAHELNTQLQGSLIAMQNIENYYEILKENDTILHTFDEADRREITEFRTWLIENMFETDITLPSPQHNRFFYEDLFEELGYENDWLINTLLDMGINNQDKIKRVIEILKKYEHKFKNLPFRLDQLIFNRSLLFKSWANLKGALHKSADITESLKTYSADENNSIMVHYDLKDATETTLAIMKFIYQQGIKIEKEYGPNVPAIPCFPSQIRQLITNLLTNACDAVRDNNKSQEGFVAITTGVEKMEGNNRKYAFISVRNSGEISEPIKEKIFKEHFTTKKNVTGYGLEIVKTIVSIHRGRIEFGSADGETFFKIYLPLEQN